MANIIAELEYINIDGVTIHSDIDPKDLSQLSDQKYRKYLHDCLDEWLDKSNGTGQFYIKDKNFTGFGI